VSRILDIAKAFELGRLEQAVCMVVAQFNHTTPHELYLESGNQLRDIFDEQNALLKKNAPDALSPEESALFRSRQKQYAELLGHIEAMNAAYKREQAAEGQ
jgi:hypothetical protein